MAAMKTVAQRPRLRKSRAPEILAARPHLAIKPAHGVVTLFGYGIQVRVDRGHLILEDGIGADRRYARFSRVDHGLKRLVTIGHDGMISLAALRWLSDQDAAFSMLERDGKVLAVTGPSRKGDAHLRRAQGLARISGVGLDITRELITRKLEGQENVARYVLNAAEAADSIATIRGEIPTLRDFDVIRLVESRAGNQYWAAWRRLQVRFPKQDLKRVPDHWRTFQARHSPLTGTPRLAATPVNAMLNYLYAILETETRLAIAALGLDPAIGFLHADAAHRESLAADIMEPVRPEVEAFLLKWISQAPLKREWFFEQRDGNCRLMADLASRLAESALTWRRAVAPVAEYVAKSLWNKIPKHAKHKPLATRLTQQTKRDIWGVSDGVDTTKTVRGDRICEECGAPRRRGKRLCVNCGRVLMKTEMTELAKKGRVAVLSAKSRAKRAEKCAANKAAMKTWDPKTLPGWLNEETYRSRVLPGLAKLTRTSIAQALGISVVYATQIARGNYIPHPRHWVKLAELDGILGKNVDVSKPRL